jgi:hypothetical protein
MSAAIRNQLELARAEFTVDRLTVGQTVGPRRGVSKLQVFHKLR